MTLPLNISAKRNETFSMSIMCEANYRAVGKDLYIEIEMALFIFW